MFINRNTSLTVHSHFYICRSLPDFSSGPLSDTTHSRQVPEEQTVFKKKKFIVHLLVLEQWTQTYNSMDMCLSLIRI